MHHARPKPGSAHRARSTPAIATSSGDNGGGQGVMRSSSDPPRFGAPERSEAAVGPGLAWKIVTLPIFGSLSLISARSGPRATDPGSTRSIWVILLLFFLGSLICFGFILFYFIFFSRFSSMFWAGLPSETLDSFIFFFFVYFKWYERLEI